MMNFLINGKFGCENCYNTFADKIDYLVKNLHGSSRHIGRKSKFNKQNETKLTNKSETISKKEAENNIEENKLEKLQRKLKEAIKDERYEDAAKIRDEIKELEK